GVPHHVLDAVDAAGHLAERRGCGKAPGGTRPRGEDPHGGAHRQMGEPPPQHPLDVLLRSVPAVSAAGGAAAVVGRRGVCSRHLTFLASVSVRLARLSPRPSARVRGGPAGGVRCSPPDQRNTTPSNLTITLRTHPWERVCRPAGREDLSDGADVRPAQTV